MNMNTSLLRSGFVAAALALAAAPALRADEAPKAPATPVAAAEFPTISDLRAKTSELVGKQVVFDGFVTGICKNGGKKAFVHDRDRKVKLTMRVDCTAGLPPFDNTWVGKPIRVTGILRELRIDKDYLDNWEAKVNGKPAPKKAAGNEDPCTEECGDSAGKEATLKQIAGLREKVAASKKGYISNLWVEGTAAKDLSAK